MWPRRKSSSATRGSTALPTGSDWRSSGTRGSSNPVLADSEDARDSRLPERTVPLFSVVVPIYNIQDYVRECAASLLNQTLTDIEVILVDDGSTDSSPSICDELASCDARVRVLHQANGGLSAARNAGMRAAVGKYVLFVDGDDYYDGVGALQQLSQHLLEHGYPEMTIFGRKILTSGNHAYRDDRALLDENLNGRDVPSLLSGLIATDSLSISACTRVVSREFLEAGRLTFVEGVVSEDIDWSLRVFNQLSTITVLDAKPYVYRRGRPGSITSSIGSKNLRDHLGIIERFAHDFQYTSDDLRDALLSYLAYQYCISLGLLVHLQEDAKAECAPRLEALRWLLRYDESPKVKTVNRTIRIVGFRVTGLALRSFIRLRRS
ncbi:glycosyltransferase [bacterium]|nr:glycosyltransferase [bacterium]